MIISQRAFYEGLSLRWWRVHCRLCVVCKYHVADFQSESNFPAILPHLPPLSSAISSKCPLNNAKLTFVLSDEDLFGSLISFFPLITTKVEGDSSGIGPEEQGGSSSKGDHYFYNKQI